jgi:hypothetical protein
MIGRVEAIAYGVAALAAIGGAIWIADIIGDRREATVRAEMEQARIQTQAALDVVQDELLTAEAENRALATRLATTRKEIDDAIRADPSACRVPHGLRRNLEQRWAPDAPR